MLGSLKHVLELFWQNMLHLGHFGCYLKFVLASDSIMFILISLFRYCFVLVGIRNVIIYCICNIACATFQFILSCY